MKCLPQNKLVLAKGNVLHDWHAEVLAIRAFNRFLVDQCADLARRGFAAGREAGWVKWKDRHEHSELPEEHGSASKAEEEAPFELQDGVSIHMYCSEAPCGDASMELVMKQQEDDTPWSAQSQPALEEGTGASMLGRGHFDRLGIVRRKPARPDAPVTLSKSCSDKLALKQCTSLLSGVVSKLVSPSNAYLSTLVLPEGQYVQKAVQRAFGKGGRMKDITDDVKMQQRWSQGYDFRPFQVMTTSRAFEYGRSPSDGHTVVPSNLSALITPQRQEILINGVLQGRKQLDPKGASCVSRRRLWSDTLHVWHAIKLDSDTNNDMARLTYGEFKRGERFSARERVKKDVRDGSLARWQRNVGDEDWKFEKYP